MGQKTYEQNLMMTRREGVRASAQDENYVPFSPPAHRTMRRTGFEFVFFHVRSRSSFSHAGLAAREAGKDICDDWAAAGFFDRFGS